MRLAVGIALLLIASCAAGEERYCKLGTTQIVADTESKIIDGLAITRFERSALLAWSDSAGLHARVLEAGGTPSSASARIGERCDGGIALASSAAGTALACLERSVPRDVTRAGSAVVYAITREGGAVTARETARYAPAGSLSEGIALAWVEGVEGPTKADAPALALAWHDASPDVHRIWLVSDASGKRSTEPQIVSTEASVANGPMLASDGARLALAWGERTARGDELESRAMLWTGEARLDGARGDASAVMRSNDTKASWVEPLPQLAFLNGELVIGYRAPGRRGQRPGLEVARITGTLGPHGVMSDARALPPKRVGRADGVGSPSVTACMGGLVTATPRSYSGDYFIGINWLSSALSHPRREQQFYEDAHAFTQAATVCLGEHALIALAELPQLDRPKAQLHVATYACQ